MALLMLHLSAACYQPRWALKLVMRVCIFLGAMLVLVFLCMLDLTCVPVSVLGGKSGHRLYKQSKIEVTSTQAAKLFAQRLLIKVKFETERC